MSMEFTETPIRPSNNGGSFVGSLRDETEEKKRLEKSNLDLKMKVLYLEENIKKMSYSSAHSDIESFEADLSGLRLQLEEKDIELEQRNLLLMKAKGAIEGLKAEINRIKVDGGKQTVLEERVQQLKVSYDLMENELKSNISQLELQLATGREKLQAKDHLIAAAEDKIVSTVIHSICALSDWLLLLQSTLELNSSVLSDRLHTVASERDKLQLKLSDYQRRVTELEEDLTQSHAQVELHKLQTDEHSDETSQVKVRFIAASYSTFTFSSMM
jgi:chromosome segregation ATPase